MRVSKRQVTTFYKEFPQLRVAMLFSKFVSLAEANKHNNFNNLKRERAGSSPAPLFVGSANLVTVKEEAAEEYTYMCR